MERDICSFDLFVLFLGAVSQRYLTAVAIDGWWIPHDGRLGEDSIFLRLIRNIYTNIHFELFLFSNKEPSSRKFPYACDGMKIFPISSIDWRIVDLFSFIVMFVFAFGVPR